MSTFSQAVYEGARKSAEGISKDELKGISKDQFLTAMRELTDALDRIPQNTNLHVVLYAVTYLRNALLLTIQQNQNRLEEETGGRA
jgi:hypothetical protein